MLSIQKVGFRTAFAEMALDTGADVIPFIVSMKAPGRFNAEFLPPLGYEKNHRSREEEVNSLVRQYVELFGRWWMTNTANVPWIQMTKHLELPRPEVPDV